MSRAKGIDQCISLMQERIIALEHELATIGQRQDPGVISSDRAAIAELRVVERRLHFLKDKMPRNSEPYSYAQMKDGWASKIEQTPSVKLGVGWFSDPARQKLKIEGEPLAQ